MVPVEEVVGRVIAAELAEESLGLRAPPLTEAQLVALLVGYRLEVVRAEK